MFGKAEYTTKCIEMTLAFAGLPVDILVVDDGSDEPFHSDKANVIYLGKNTGFTNACSQGMLWAVKRDYKYVHTLNNDTEPRQDFIKILYDVLENDHQMGICNSVRLHSGLTELKKDQHGYPVELYGADLIRGYQMYTTEQNITKTELIECNWVPICSALIRTEMIRYLGVLDRRMRNHSSDVEYCLRARVHGWKVSVHTGSIVLHHHEVTTRSNMVNPESDQKVWLGVLAGQDFGQFMAAMPLDAERKIYGKLDFSTEERK
jgi:GT2 family glycosyltransferase